MSSLALNLSCSTDKLDLASYCLSFQRSQDYIPEPACLDRSAPRRPSEFSVWIAVLQGGHQSLVPGLQCSRESVWVCLYLVTDFSICFAGCLRSLYLGCSLSKAELWHKAAHIEGPEWTVFSGSLLSSQYSWIRGMSLETKMLCFKERFVMWYLLSELILHFCNLKDCVFIMRIVKILKICFLVKVLLLK